MTAEKSPNPFLPENEKILGLIPEGSQPLAGG
jgi:hypothetical protein